MKFILPAIITAAFVPSMAFAQNLSATQKTISHQSVPQGAQRVPMLQIDLRASCEEDILINDIALRHTGLGASSDIPRVYLTDGTRRLSTSVSFSGRNRSATLRPRGLIIKACNERTLTIAADFSADAAAGGEHRIILAGIGTDNGPTIVSTINGASSARATPSTTGTITVEYLPLHSTVRYGNNRIISRIRLNADGEADQSVTSITLTNDGSARDEDLVNLELMDGQNVLAEIGELDGDTARFVLDEPLQIGRNASKLLTVRADLRASIKRTIRLIVEEPSDIVAGPEQRRRQ
jgi:hypothetical protein